MLFFGHKKYGVLNEEVPWLPGHGKRHALG